MPSVTLITLCKGRLNSIRKSLSTMVATGLPVVLVDYDDPDNVSGWVKENHPQVKLAHVSDRPTFNYAAARNIGAGVAETEWILLIDADVYIPDPGKLYAYLEVLPKSLSYICHKQPCGALLGTCLVRLADYYAVEGSDTVINKYGASYPDIDLFAKLTRYGCHQQHFPHTESNPSLLFDHIEHEDRGTFYAVKDHDLTSKLNVTYFVIKSTILAAQNKDIMELPYEYRLALMDELYQTMLCPTAASSPLTVEIALPPVNLPREKVQLERTMKFTIKL